MGITSGILVETGSIHSLARFTWPSIPSNQSGDTGGFGLAYTLQCGSGNRGTSLDITHSQVQLLHSWRTRYGGRKVHGVVLCSWHHDHIKGPIMSPRIHQCYHRTLHKGRPDGQCRKIQDHDLPSGGDLHRDIKVGFQSEEHRTGGQVPGASVTTHPMSGLQGGVIIRVHYGPLQTISWDWASNRLGSTTGQSYITPSTYVWGHLPYQYAVVPVSVPRMSRDVPQ